MKFYCCNSDIAQQNINELRFQVFAPITEKVLFSPLYKERTAMFNGLNNADFMGKILVYLVNIFYSYAVLL